MTKVKICGLKERKHVEAAVEAGADAIGFVFAPSSRRVTIEEARELAKSVPEGVLKIGVFVDATEAELKRTFEEVPLDFIQYHGDEEPEFIQQVGLPAIKAVSVRDEEDVRRAARYDVKYFLFDTPGTEFKGGSGKTFDWTLLEEAGVRPEQLILAGGLTVENVGEAIVRVHPYMVDVSSGVEIDKRKDVGLIRSFLDAVKMKER
ncbi:phosphoribosylanthranilate isomerase [Bacillus sp. OxB-1]|uniref:phosphoribosylanthranilate isomerase n=1 Tax=Bacillus sp. (strain OxB-1) TaxID=98228 RepID=UPI0005822C0C|nr:phosphoribosylanthranilate isomerase [Bacillus sp. OxB-1]BAQ09288.1 phosphoribosylanthranilate isomerase [Bacillus sp. OxB-1]